MKKVLIVLSIILFSFDVNAGARSKGASQTIQVNLAGGQEKEKEILFKRNNNHIDINSIENIDAISCYLYQDGKELGGMESVNKCQFNIDKSNYSIKYTVSVKNENNNKTIEVEIKIY